MKTTDDIKTGKLYWGAMPLPQGAELVGTVTRETGETGALIKMARGNMVQGNAGAIRSLPPMRGKNKNLHIRIEESLYNKFLEATDEKAVNRSELVRRWIEKYVEEDSRD